MTIKDKLIQPFEINWDDTFTVLGYFVSLEMALLFICKILTENSFEVATIKEVVERYEQVWLDIKNTIKI